MLYKHNNNACCHSFYILRKQIVVTTKLIKLRGLIKGCEKNA